MNTLLEQNLHAEQNLIMTWLSGCIMFHAPFWCYALIEIALIASRGSKRDMKLDIGVFLTSWNSLSVSMTYT